LRTTHHEIERLPASCSRKLHFGRPYDIIEFWLHSEYLMISSTGFWRLANDKISPTIPRPGVYLSTVG